MDDPRWLRMITIGLVLAALAVGYFLFTGGLTSNSTQKVTNKVTQTSSTPAPVPVLTITPQSTATPSAYTRLSQRAQGGVQTLPNTGFPAGLVFVFSTGALISGWGLRKYPH